MSKYKLKITSDPQKFPIDISDDPIFLQIYDTKEELKVGIRDFFVHLISEIYKKTELKLYRDISFVQIIESEKYSVNIGYVDNDRSLHTQYIRFEIAKIPTETYIVTKVIFKDGDYLFSEILGKADGYPTAEGIRNIDKTKYAEAYNTNGWTVKYLFNRID